MMAEESTDNKNTKVNINVKELPTLYTDAVFIASDPHDFGVVFNFAQHTGNELHVVSRVGMSIEHAHNLLETLNNHLGKRNQKK